MTSQRVLRHAAGAGTSKAGAGTSKADVRAQDAADTAAAASRPAAVAAADERSRGGTIGRRAGGPRPGHRLGYELAAKSRPVPPIASEAITGGIWQVLHDYIDTGRVAELPDVAPQVVYLALFPFLGSRAAAKAARLRPDALS